MALRDQPYFPFYVDDYLTDEKLIECSVSSQGVYMRILCVMHKSEEYGTILLKQKDKQNEQQILNFAEKLQKHMPFKIEVITESIKELVEEDVLQLIGDKLLQKRMIRDNDISIKRSEAGSKGGFATAKHTAKDQAKQPANTVNENEYVIEDETVSESERVFDEFRKKYPGSKRGLKTEYENFRKRHRDHSIVLPLLLPALDNQSAWRLEMSLRGEFVPQWKMLQVWINQRCWEMEKPTPEVQQTSIQLPKVEHRTFTLKRPCAFEGHDKIR